MNGEQRRRVRKVLLIGAGALGGLVALLYLLGALEPREHTAAVRATYRAAPDVVFHEIRDVARAAEWRSGLRRVEVLSAPGEPMRWRETADWGTLTFRHDAIVPGRRIVSRIVDEGQGFGGTWTWDVEPAAEGGSTLTITEHGVVDDPVYRFISRWVMGYHSSLETYARDLAVRLDETVEPERVP